MYSFKGRLWIQSPASQPFGYFTRYSLPYKLDEQHILLVNGLTGAIDVVSAEEHRLLLENPAGYGERYPAEAFVLAQRGYLFADAAQESRVRAELIELIKAGLPQRDAVFMLCPTDYCPMGCSYCFAKGRPAKAERRVMSDGDIDAAFKVIEQLQSRFDRRVGSVVLYGGEPFQDFTAPALARIFERARHGGMKIAAFSNGSAISSFRQLFIEYSRDIYVISVTLDGVGPKHDAFRVLDGSFDRAVESIDTLIQLRVPVQIKMNLNKRNIAEIPGMVDFYRRKGWWHAEGVFFELSPIQYQGLAECRDTVTNIELALDFLEMLRQQPELTRFTFLPLVDNKYHLIDSLGIHSFPTEQVPLHSAVPRIHNCPSYSQHMFVFGADGRFYLCNEEVGVNQACFGSLAHGGGLDIERMAQHFMRDMTTLGGCDECPYALFCGGGCGHHAEAPDKHFCGTLAADFRQIVDRYRDFLLARCQIA